MFSAQGAATTLCGLDIESILPLRFRGLGLRLHIPPKRSPKGCRACNGHSCGACV